MNIGIYSKNRILETFSRWEVPHDFAQPFYNYLVYGWEPGSCFSAVLANDFYNAMSHSHPANNVVSFKALVGWIRDIMPRESYGSYHTVEEWTKLSASERRTSLENAGLVYSPEEEMILTLQGEPIKTPVLN
ncbi:hypothetical protein UFOVP71_224 [uncultured Caudovirales phage]|uniref:Uncharacterized protein n=1 Tax=uncultured Caudovirales phage TaxID=2100421 RepID=A0A6J5T9V5_9CAUD|nr:hypothetical protein UFOVP71_224 [uncultured Caudovirales phage]